MHCRECGKEVNLNETYCSNCGQRVIALNEQNSENQVMNNASFKQKSNKKMIFIIIGIIVGFVVLLSIIGLSIVVILSLNNEYKNPVEVIDNNLTETLKLKDLTLKYDRSWNEEYNSGTDSKVIKRDKVILTLNYSKSDWYYTTTGFAEEMIKEYEDNENWNYNTVSLGKETINGKEWSKLEFIATVNGEKRKGLQYFFSTDYEYYSIIYMSAESDYNSYINEVNKFIKTIELYTKPVNSQDVKKKILGEWDCGTTGYLVINDDNTYYFYENSSQSMDNVIYGTYECSDGIPTYAAGYAEGILFIGNIKKATVDGEDKVLNTGDNKIQYGFSPNGTDGKYYNSKNINTGSTFTMRKIK